MSLADDALTPDDQNWQAFASVCIAALFEILLQENRILQIPFERIEDIRFSMAHKMVALAVSGPTEDGTMMFSTLLTTADERPN